MQFGGAMQLTEFSVVGQRIPREEGPMLACGQAAFAGDIALPRMLIGGIKRSAIPHARVLNVDTSRAVGLPGVKAVITGKDIVLHKFGPFADEYSLAIEKVRY